ncbi:MAG: hypothetical protein V4665_01470 [Patescibacteria group bacterium]
MQIKTRITEKQQLLKQYAHKLYEIIQTKDPIFRLSFASFFKKRRFSEKEEALRYAILYTFWDRFTGHTLRKEMEKVFGKISDDVLKKIFNEHEWRITSLPGYRVFRNYLRNDASLTEIKMNIESLMNRIENPILLITPKMDNGSPFILALSICLW